MRFYVGDENGLIKTVVIPSNSITLNPKDPPALQTTVKPWGCVDPRRNVNLMCKRIITGNNSDFSQFVIARQNGQIEIVDKSSPVEIKRVYEFKEETIMLPDMTKKEKNKIKSLDEDNKNKININNHEKNSKGFIGLFANESTLVTCTGAGTLRYWTIPSDPLGAPLTIKDTLNIQLPLDLCRLRVLPKQPNLIAFGGKERDLSVWDVNGSQVNKPEETKNSPIRPIIKHKPLNKYQKVEQKESCRRIWNAKNFPNDALSLRHPIWITDLQFMSEDDPSKIVVGTKYKQIRLYDIRTQRRPVLNVIIGENPVASVSMGRNPYEIVAGDTALSVLSMDIRTGQCLGHYKGFTGAVRDLAIDPASLSLVSVSCDRFLRVHSTNEGRKLLNKVYLKQRLTCLIIDKDSKDYNNANKRAQEDDQEEEIWQQMESVEQNKMKKRKLAKSDSNDADL
ncbi:hypothetical protein G9A89_005491 [Geosiphon pyriformis]|nr:hypothetical protein G9A89_005491 [Geosiphon pyriformis]